MKSKIIVIVGPTGSGKTKLAIELANKFDGELINADAFQVYKEIGIGTAKTTEDELQGTPIYLNGSISIYDQWDIKYFQNKANEIISDIISRNKTPIIVGGSNLYVSALIHNYDLSAQERDEKFEDLTNQEIYDKIYSVNKEKALTLQLNNRRRLIRALQIISSNGALDKKNEELYDYILLSNKINREELYSKIEKNVYKMFDNGWINEVEQLYKKDKQIRKLNAMKAIGYQNILDYIENNIPINKEEISQKSKRYAKMQLTWIRNKFTNVVYIDDSNKQKVLSDIGNWLNNDGINN